MSKLVLTAAMKKAGIVAIERSYGKNVYLLVVLTSKLFVDPRYQREFDKKWAGQMASKEPPVAPDPTCSYRAGKVRILDGQHRKANCHEDTIVVKCIFGLTEAQEADCYATLNECKRPNPWNRFKARLVGKNPIYVSIKASCDKAGLSLGCDQSHADLRCAEVLEEVQKRNLLNLWLTAICAFKTDTGLLNGASAGAGEFQRGLIEFVDRHGASKVIVQTLKKILPSQIRQKGVEICKCNSGKPNREHYYDAILIELAYRGLYLQPKKLAA